MDAGPFESHIADLPVMPPGLTPAELIFATTTPKEVGEMYDNSLAYTHSLHVSYKQALANADDINRAYFGNVEELTGTAATAVNDRLLASVHAGEKPSAEYLNALLGYDAQTASRRYMETGSDADDYLANIEDAEEKARILSDAFQDERDLQYATERAQSTPDKVRSGAIILGGLSVLVTVESGIFMVHGLQNDSSEAARLTSVGKESSFSDVEVWATVGAISLVAAAAAATLLVKAKNIPHWRARRKLKQLQATGPSNDAY